MAGAGTPSRTEMMDTLSDIHVGDSEELYRSMPGPQAPVPVQPETDPEPPQPPAPLPSPRHPFPVEECKRRLIQHCDKKLRKQRPISWNQKVIVDVKETFTTIDILPYNQRHKAYRQPIQKVTDIFKPRPDCDKPRQIVLWGDSGIGKTTILAKLVMAWTEDVPVEALQQFDLVFPIALGRVKRTQSLVDCIFDQLLPEDVSFSKQDLQEYLQDNKKVLIILDAYDEWKPFESHDIAKLISGDILPDCSLLVATMTTCASDLLEKMNPDTRVEVLGFSPDNVKSYILDKFFKNDPAKGEALLEKVGPVLLKTGILSIPILLMHICVLWEDEKDILLRDKICRVYDQLVSYLLKRGTTGKNPAVRVADIKHLCQALEKMALECLLEKKFVFDGEDVRKYCGPSYKDLVKLGLLKEEESPSRQDPIVQYSFSHKTMQVYFAAQCLAERLEGVNKREILQQHFPTVRMIQMFGELLVLTCGKLEQNAKFVLHHLRDIHDTPAVEDVDQEFYNFFATGKSKKDWNKDIKLEDFASAEDLTHEFAGQWNDYPPVLLVFQSFIELYLLCCHESGLTAQFAEQVFLRDSIQFSGASPRVYSVLSHMIAEESEKVKKMEHLRLVNTQNYVLGPALEELHKLPGLTELNLRQSRLGGHQLEATRTIPRRLELRFKHRRLMKTSADDLAKAPALLAEKLHWLRSLKKLVISWNDLGPEDMKQQILPAIRELINLEELFLSGNDLRGLGKDVADLVAFLPKLKEFKVYFCQLAFEEIKMIASSLKEHCPDLTLFDFQLNPIQPDKSIWVGERELDTIEDLLGGVFIPRGVNKLPPPAQRP
ncbi:uncharacterized protein LOC144918805 isoform X2 [Branchiostoma floridae x Branchiostoma belcheri]